MNFDSNTTPWINGTIRNRKTGAELHGKRRSRLASSAVFAFWMDGTTHSNSFYSDDWVFTPDPEPLKDGYYLLDGAIYRVFNGRATYANLNRTGRVVQSVEYGLRTLQQEGVFLGDLEGNR